LKPQTLNNTETQLNAENKEFFTDVNNTDYNTYGLDKMFYSNNTY